MIIYNWITKYEPSGFEKIVDRLVFGFALNEFINIIYINV